MTNEHIKRCSMSLEKYIHILSYPLRKLEEKQQKNQRTMDVGKNVPELESPYMSDE